MTEHQKLINKAKKIASMMQSPFEQEVVVAASLLKKLLDEHNMTLQELGLNIKTEDLNRTANNGSAAKDSNLRDVFRTTDKTSHEETLKVDNNKIMEIIYKHPLNEMEAWHKDLLVRIATVYGARAATTRDRHYGKIIGFPSDVEVVKFVLINLRKYIKAQLLKHGYTDEKQINGYAMGLTCTIVQKIKDDTEYRSSYESRMLAQRRLSRIAEHIDIFYQDIDVNMDNPSNNSDCRAFKDGMYDGNNYFNNSSRSNG